MTAPADQAAAASATDAAAAVVAIADSALRLELDSSLRLRVSHVRAAESPTALTVWAAPDSLLLADGRRIERFPKLRATREPLDGR